MSETKYRIEVNPAYVIDIAQHYCRDKCDNTLEKAIDALNERGFPVTPVDAQPTGLTEFTPEFEAKLERAFAQIKSGKFETYDTVDDFIAPLRTQAGVGLTEEEIEFMEKAMQKFVSWGSTSRQWAEIAPIVAKLKASLRTQAGVVLRLDEDDRRRLDTILDDCKNSMRYNQTYCGTIATCRAQLKAGG